MNFIVFKMSFPHERRKFNNSLVVISLIFNRILIILHKITSTDIKTDLIIMQKPSFMDTTINIRKILLSVLIFISISCARNSTKTEMTGRIPSIDPDYSGVTIPPNIAPLNFIIHEESSDYRVEVSGENGSTEINIESDNGVIRFPGKKWKNLLAENIGNKIRIQVYSRTPQTEFKYDPFFMHIAKEPVDPYLAYRLIFPGYYSWSHIRIAQRCIESFEEHTLADNSVLDNNCINCHTFNSNNPDQYLIHIRGSKSGTYFFDRGIMTRTDPKIVSMPGSATYPAWHPNGRFVAFSSNQVRQGFYAHYDKSIEVFDLVSSLIIYDMANNEIINVPDNDSVKYQHTFPTWSPDGKFLYFCRAEQKNNSATMTPEEIQSTRYDLVRILFDKETRTFGNTEVVYHASDSLQSVSFPRISPDGKWLIMTLHDFGTFPIWHKEADLYVLNLENGRSTKMALNSSETESYHSWSSNGKWLIFSSKRTDGRSTRPFFAYVNNPEDCGKPFILPQQDPDKYENMLESYNIPELVKDRIKSGPRDFETASMDNPLKAKPAESGAKSSVEYHPGNPVH